MIDLFECVYLLISNKHTTEHESTQECACNRDRAITWPRLKATESNCYVMCVCTPGHARCKDNTLITIRRKL